MRKYLPVLLSLVVFLLATAEIIIGDVPAWVLPMLTIVLIPVLVEGIRWLVSKAPQLSWLTGKVALSILTYVIAVGVTAAFTQWGQLPPLPADAAEAVNTILGYATALFGAATILYNVLYAHFLDAWAKPQNALSYRLYS
jgi:hypothetical protein